MKAASVLTFCTFVTFASSLEIDKNGYVVYCPCMGRFGNQADHFFGSLSFAHSLNRTLILPPWVEYDYSKPNSSQVPFDTYFLVEPLRSFHRVITMDAFMKDLAPTVWPLEKRTVFCYSARYGKSDDCNAKDGNPFGPFWDHFHIDFTESKFYGDQLSYDDGGRWNQIYPPSEYPVLAFVGAPAAFPIRAKDRHLHKHLHWAPNIVEKARRFIKTVLPEGPFVAIHFRNDLDWDNVCKHVSGGQRQLFASPQCLGYNNEFGQLSMEICMPSIETIVKQTRDAAKRFNAKSVFVGADRQHLIPELNKALKKLHIKAFRLDPDDQPHVTLAIFGMANHFIANCVSSFSSFAKRERDVKNLSSSFWGFKKPRNDDEL